MVGSIRRRGVWVRWWLGSNLQVGSVTVLGLVDLGWFMIDIGSVVPLDERFEVVEDDVLKYGFG